MTDTHGYIRASSGKQQDSPDVQKHAIREYCQRMGLGTPIWYVDVATTSKIPLNDRESGKEMMRRIKKGDHIVVSKLDRPFRSLRDCVIFLDEVQRINVNVHVCNMMGGMALDLTSPIGKFLVHILASFAELERSLISERVSDGMRAARRRGGGGGRPNYGFKHVSATREMADGTKRRGLVMVEDPHERKIMKMIVALRAQGWSWFQIREKLSFEMKIKTSQGKEWNESRIKRAAKAELLLQLREMSPGAPHEGTSY